MDRPVMVYTGGKFLLKDWIISLLPEHEIYVEPFGGAASVLMSKPRSKREVYNDLNGDVVNVFKVLRTPMRARLLKLRLELTPFSREEMQIAKIYSNDTLVERARKTIVCAFMSRSRQAKDVAGMRYSKESNRAPESDWVNYLEVLPQFTDRLKGVMIENKEASKLFGFWDGLTTLFYCDPPYLFETRNDKNLYKHELNNDGHVQLLKTLAGLKGMVVLSGYDSELYKEHLNGWTVFKKESKKNTHEKTIECLWLNPQAVEKTKQINFMDDAGQVI